MTFPRKKRIDRYGLRLEQVQRVVAIALKLGIGQNVENKNVDIFFLGRDRGVTGRFFRSYRRSAILFIFARSFLTQKELYPL